MKLKNKPNITLQALKNFGFYVVGTNKGLDVYYIKIDIPFSINPFRRIINPNAKDGLVFTATASPELTEDMKSKKMLYIVGVNVDTSIAQDCILINKKTLQDAMNFVKECYSNHIDYGNFLLKARNEKQNIQLVKNVKNIVGL
nr:hypothetical protein [uncultured Mediterranean phage uvMED]